MAENVIELNGKRYDAMTGAYLGEGNGKPYAPPSQHKAQPQKNKGKHIDGFFREGNKKSATVLPKVVKPTTKPMADVVVPRTVKASSVLKSEHKTVHKPAHTPIAATAVHKKVTKAPGVARPLKTVAAAKADVKPASKTITPEHRVSVTTKPHQPQHAKTLMRRVVHKPHFSIKPAIKTQAPAEIVPASASSILFKPSVSRIDQERLKRAKSIAKYSGIRHFMPIKPDYTPDVVESLPHHAADAVPVIAVRPVPAHAHGQPAHKRTHTDIFEAAIARADSHKQPPHKAVHRSRRRRLANTLAGVAALLVIGGFVTYLNLPGIEMHFASIQAGFKAEMPDYKPTGYALKGGVQRTGNTISLSFVSGENHYTITQQPSPWNSQTLEENTMALANHKHKTIEANGRTVFIYGGSNATWVNGGIRYDLTTNAPLSTDDITKLAASL